MGREWELAWRERKLQALSAAITEYEAEFVVITEEMAVQQRVDRGASRRVDPSLKDRG
jgi:hypothetical protein